MESTEVILRSGSWLAQWILPPWPGLVVPCLASCLAGTFGGIVSNIISARGRQTSNQETSAAGWKHGLLGDITIGVAIGLVTFWSGIADVPISKILVASLIGGVSGAKYFSQQHEVKEARSQARKEISRSKVLGKTTELALASSLQGKLDAEK